LGDDQHQECHPVDPDAVVDGCERISGIAAVVA
jgi:hypothetical protein